MILKDDEVADLATLFGSMRTYVFRPSAEGRYPGIVLFFEILQVTGPIRRTAALLAGSGYVVAVPGIYHEIELAGTVLPYDKVHPHCTGRLGVIGICLGGHLAFRAAMNPDVRAAACFYATDIHKHSLGKGMNDNTLGRMGEITGVMLMIWGRQYPHVPREGRQLIYNAMNDAGLTLQWHEFNAAHAFLRDEGPRYDPAAAQICYSMVRELFHRRLGEGDQPAEHA